MPDAMELANKVKEISVNAVEATKPMQIMFGTVSSISPLRIYIEQKLELEEKHLILTRNVTDYQVEMSVEHMTEDESAHTHDIQDTYSGGGTSSSTVHHHAYAGRKTYTVHNGLAAGERVILLRQQGGQKFIIWDRVGI